MAARRGRQFTKEGEGTRKTIYKDQDKFRNI
jgi:GH24 family phage-related lysozyme (muramidase)